jgi:SAM-dependent methyltransferase
LLKTDLFDEALTPGLYPLLATRADVVGADVAVSTARAARSRHARLRAVGADVRSLPFASGTFDVVVSISTLDHFGSMADILASLCELHRVLRPGGQLLLTLDNLANPLVALRNALPFGLLNALGIVPYRVGTTCGPRRLRRAVRESGFEVLDVAAVLHCPRVLAVAGAALFNRFASSRAQREYVHWLLPFERLGNLPSRFLTGYYTAVVARKR